MKRKKINTSLGVDLDLKKHKSKYVIEAEREDPKLPALFVFVVPEEVEKPMLVWLW